MMMQTSFCIIKPKLRRERNPPSKTEKIPLAAETQIQRPPERNLSQVIFVYVNSDIAEE
jgi:hypothetical protein